MENFEKQVIGLLSDLTYEVRQLKSELGTVNMRLDKIEDRLTTHEYRMELINQKLEIIMEQTAKNTVQITQLKKA